MPDIYWYPEPNPRGPTVQRDADGNFTGLLVAPRDIMGCNVQYARNGSGYEGEVDTRLGTLRWSSADLGAWVELRDAIFGPPPPKPVAPWEPPPRPLMGVRRR